MIRSTQKMSLDLLPVSSFVFHFLLTHDFRFLTLKTCMLNEKPLRWHWVMRRVLFFVLLFRHYCVLIVSTVKMYETLTTYQFMFSIHTFNSTFTQFQAQHMGEGATGWFQTWHKELKKRSHQRIIGSHENLYFRFICSAT